MHACNNESFSILSNIHFRYAAHNCASGLQNDGQVPVCPLCQAPIPIKRGELPDKRVGQHIDSDCQSDKALSHRKVFTNACSAKGCKKKEMMRVECTSCRQSFCIGHRFPDDHQCQGPRSSVSQAGYVSCASCRVSNSIVKYEFEIVNVFLFCIDLSFARTVD